MPTHLRQRAHQTSLNYSSLPEVYDQLLLLNL